MADDDKNKPSSGIKLGDLKKLITDTVQEAVKGVAGSGDNSGVSDSNSDDGAGNHPSGASRRKSVAEQVTEALARIEEGKKREERDKTIDSTLAELKAKTQEKPPIERTRRHKFMGWGEPNE